MRDYLTLQTFLRKAGPDGLRLNAELTHLKV
jgi:hypothetical protein